MPNPDARIFLAPTNQTPKEALIEQIEMILASDLSDGTKLRFIKEQIRK